MSPWRDIPLQEDKRSGLVMPFVFPVMVNQQYGNAYYQIPILLIAVIFQILVGLYSAIYIALKKSRSGL